MRSAEIKAVLMKELPRLEVRYDEPLAGHTTLRLGGPTPAYIVPGDGETVARVVQVLASRGIRPLAMGGGSNLLVGDRGVEEPVISVSALAGKDIREDCPGEAVLCVGAGLSLAGLLSLMRQSGLTGLEGLVGIPGQVGGAVAGNAGAFGREMKDVLCEVTVVDAEGTVHIINKEGLDFGYRRSGLPAGSVIIASTMAFGKDEPEAVAARMKRYLEEKKSRQPLGQWSAGCVFKNPQGGEPAGKLIEEAGCKGLAEGGIQVSPVHANFFVNTGEGTAADFTALMEKVAERVLRASGVSLEPEIRVVGRC
ncbi:MAG: UDP-N-acetylmuramate dehydrogenase [Nitrospirota bacterium]|jgi:UDP-N-acetylmuramate dehydrogenase